MMQLPIIQNNFLPNFTKNTKLSLNDHRFDPAGRLWDDCAYSP